MAVSLPMVLTADGAELSPVAWWPLGDAVDQVVRDKVGGVGDAIDGSFTEVAGVRGNAVRFDGYTTEITRSADKMPALSGGFERTPR